MMVTFYVITFFGHNNDHLWACTFELGQPTIFSVDRSRMGEAQMKRHGHSKAQVAWKYQVIEYLISVYILTISIFQGKN